MQKWNIATDIEINTVLYKHGFQPPKSIQGLFPENSYKLTIPASIFGKEVTIKQIKQKVAEKIYAELPNLPTDYNEPRAETTTGTTNRRNLKKDNGVMLCRTHVWHSQVLDERRVFYVGSCRTSLIQRYTGVICLQDR